jgi:hypothetical protein
MLPGAQEVDVTKIVTPARLWPARPEESGRRTAGAAARERGTRARGFYLGISFVFAVLTYIAVHLIQVVGATLNAAATAADPLTGGILVHVTSLVAWVSACMLAGLLLHQYLSRLGTSLNAEHRRGEKLALVSDVSGALTGPHPPADIAIRFLQRIRKVVSETTTSAVLLYDEAAESLGSLAADGPLADDLGSASVLSAFLPEPIPSWCTT